MHIPNLPAGAAVSAVVVSCAGVDAFNSTLRAFGVIEDSYNGAFQSRMITLNLGSIAVTIELAEIGKPEPSWLSRERFSS